MRPELRAPRPSRLLSPAPQAPTPSSRPFGEFVGPFFFMLEDELFGQPSGSTGFSSFPPLRADLAGVSPRGSRSRPDGEPISDLFDLISGNSLFSPLLEEPDIAGVFRRRGRDPGSNAIIFGQGGTDRLREAVTGDPLVQLDPARDPSDRPLCLDDPNVEGCGDVDTIPKPPIVDAEAACPDTPILGSNLSDTQIANQIEDCVNAFRVDPDAFATMVPCEFAFRGEVLMPRRGPLGAVKGTSGNNSDPLDRAAISHSMDMSSSGFMFGHYGSDGIKLDDRLATMQNFTGYPFGEIIAARYHSVREVVTGLACYPRHRAILTSCAFDSIGTGVAIDEFSPLDVYVTLNFGCSRTDGDCTCTENGPPARAPAPAPTTEPVPPTATGGVTDVGDIPGPIVCAATSETAGLAGGSIMATANETSENTTTSEVSSFGAKMYAVGMMVFGKECMPTTGDSDVHVLVFFQTPQPVFDRSLLVATLEDGRLGRVSDLEPVEDRDNLVWSARVQMPRSFSGVVQMELLTPDGIPPTLTFQKLQRDEMMMKLASILEDGGGCP